MCNFCNLNDDIEDLTSTDCSRRSLEGLTPEQLAFNTAIMRLMGQTVTAGPAVMTQAHWDFVLCSMVAWVQVRHYTCV